MGSKWKYQIIPGILSGLVVLSAGGVLAASQSSHNLASPADSPSSFIAPVAEKIQPKIETRTETHTTEIPYETITEQDNTLAKGTTRVVSEGEIGLREKVYHVTYTDGIETSRELVSDTVTKEPVKQIISEGTYIAPAPAPKSTPQPQSAPATQCTNGTYVNSAGNSVCRPSETSNGNATARCHDGTYSHSQSHRGACSHHGGVAHWF